MSSRFHLITRAAALSAILTLGSQVFSTPAFPQYSAQSDDGDPEMRIQQLENQLRQLTGQNEELQHQNQQLRGTPEGASGRRAASARRRRSAAFSPASAALPPPQPNPAYRQPAGQPGYDQPQIAAPAPIYQEEVPAQGAAAAAMRSIPARIRTRPAYRARLGGGQLPMATGAPVGAPGGRAAGEPLSLESPSQRDAAGALPPPRGAGPNAGPGLTTLPPSATPRDEFDLGIGYMQRKDYALADETMRNFAQKYPSDPMVADSQYWLGESFFQRQQYRDAAEAFLAVTTKFDKSAKAPDALLRLGQSLAALKEKEAACAAFGEVTRKYPRASSGVKAAVDREQKRVKC